MEKYNSVCTSAGKNGYMSSFSQRTPIKNSFKKYKLTSVVQIFNRVIVKVDLFSEIRSRPKLHEAF